MNKTIFITSLLAAMLLCGCNGALDPNEEPLIRGKGIVDRIYLTSEDHPEKDTHCTLSFEDNKLVLTFDKVISFTLSLWDNDKNLFVFGQKYYDVSSCTIDLSTIEEGSYSLYLDNSCLCNFAIKDGSYVEQGNNDMEEKEVEWYEGDGLFLDVRYLFEAPQLDFSASRYPYTEEELKEWPFGKVEHISTSMSYRDGNFLDDSTLITERDTVLRTRWYFSLGTEFTLRTATHGSFSSDFAISDSGNDYEEGAKPKLSGQTFSYEGKPLEDLWTSYTRGFMLPSEFNVISKQEDDNGNTNYIAEMADTVRPATAPYLIEVIDAGCMMTSVESIIAEGFAAQYSLSVCEPYEASCKMNADEILPEKSVILADGSPANVVAAKLRTWGRVGNSSVVLSYTIVSENDNVETFTIDVTDQVIAQPQGGVIDVFVPQKDLE